MLYSPSSYRLHQSLISAGQRLHFSQQHACWTHCALYVGGGYVVDSVGKGGVDQRSIETLTQDGHIRVRRLTTIAPTDQQELAKSAVSWVGTGYAKFKAVMAAVTPYLPKTGTFVAKQLNGREELLYCAELVESVYATELNISVCRNTGLPLPAAYSADAQFSDVPIGWRVAV